jgi:hypothetical protein
MLHLDIWVFYEQTVHLVPFFDDQEHCQRQAIKQQFFPPLPQKYQLIFPIGQAAQHW